MMTTFGRKLGALRRNAGLSQLTVAEAVGIDHTYLSRIECGHSAPPSMTTLAAIVQLCVESLPAEEGIGLDILDDLTLSAKRIPADIKEILFDHFSLCQELRRRFPAEREAGQ